MSKKERARLAKAAAVAGRTELAEALAPAVVAEVVEPVKVKKAKKAKTVKTVAEALEAIGVPLVPFAAADVAVEARVEAPVVVMVPAAVQALAQKVKRAEAQHARKPYGPKGQAAIAAMKAALASVQGTVAA